MQITEEKIKSIDYDVWLDRSPERLTVYRYDLGKSVYTTCKNCGGKTVKHTKTETPGGSHLYQHRKRTKRPIPVNIAGCYLFHIYHRYEDSQFWQW